MKRHNRKRKTYHLKLAHLSGVILSALMILPWTIPVFIDLSSDQIGSEVKRLEYEKRSLEASLRRQNADWNRLIEPKRLDEAVRQNGMNLSYAPPERSIIVRKDGRLEIPAALHATLQQERIARMERTKNEAVAATSSSRQRITRSRR